MDSQRLRVLRHLAKGKSLTPLNALRLFGTLRLSGRIKELRDEGWPIETEMVTVSGARVAKYRIAR